MGISFQLSFSLLYLILARLQEVEVEKVHAKDEDGK